MATSSSRKKGAGKPKTSLLSRIPARTRNTILIGLGCAALLGGGVWLYYKVTTIPPPAVAKSSAQKVCDYLGDPRGFNRLSIPRREEFLTNTYQHFNTDAGREEFNRALRAMSVQERQAFLDATIEVARDRVMKFADEYRRTPRRDQTKFVDNVITGFRALQGDLGGRGNPNMNVGEPFKPFAPQRSDELGKMLVTKTTARERAKAQPLIDAISKRMKEMQAIQPRG
ncbi:MAG TPA: hypothetical protein VLM89_11685 [Phycisphaerae bacterium]|nr:hypothetical protein [Phycisphaerae bacterium]